ncbi:AraC-like DNA-binding protein [Nonomuraea muscovyensis]|uniref:AraC-like DNA-binding protein n=1 Tax=Nonomuraea muscovyensis TaxID=1124761 RepID=A0A7X0CE11_9ACTN|nr:AraC family transcriptional regulator [Nonomuraea muscovyensis]MBB6352241.1 AraC-like DNA-binding protein [Nonomuraea muscovyensis]
MRSAVRVGAGPGFALDAVTCDDDHRRWSPVETSSAHRLVLVRRGRFRRLADGRSSLADPTLAYLSTPGEEERFAHPAGGDVCTSVSLSAGLWRTLAGEDVRPSRSALYVDARLDVAHRRFLAAARAGDAPFGLAEALLSLLSGALRQVTDRPLREAAGGEAARGAARRSTSPAAIVDAAREAIACDHEAAGDLLSLAELLGVSPYRLSRAFTRELGVSLTHYRNRVRVGRALDRLERGERGLARLAADLGFADQAHLTRTIRRHAGHTPTAMRHLLTHPEADGPAGGGRRAGPVGSARA